MPLTDAEARLAITERLDETLFVEAGAGSGKTTCLVDRFIALVESGVPADVIAAITFTEQAAAELSDRIRQRLQEASSPTALAALEVLDRAAIGTLHSFARRILTEYPVEAGLPPRVEVLDEIASQVEFDDRWEMFVDRLVDDQALERPLRLLLASGARLKQLRDVAIAFNANWDLVAERAGRSSPEPPPVVDIDRLCQDIDELCVNQILCRDSNDRLCQRLVEIAEYGSQLRAANDEERRLELLHSPTVSFKAGVGQKGNWPDVESIREQVRSLGDRVDDLAGEVARACLLQLADEVARFTIESARARQAEGRLEFHDLLVLARAVLRDPDQGPEVRAGLRGRYQRLLLDEFQDTDPIQVELAVLVASTEADAGQRPWHEAQIEPGRLFFVGDPKQSIYRFRRADIGVFLRARDSLVGGALELTSNFRTAEPVVAWVNRTFSQIIREAAGSQPAYLPLDPTRPSPPDGPPVTLLGRDIHNDNPTADRLREYEAADVAAVARRAVDEGWSVRDGGRVGEEVWRRAGWRDICILVPARTSLPMLEMALAVAEVPYRVETSSLVYSTREVRDLLAAVRAIDDVTDQLSLVTALRSPAFGCGDDDLFRWRLEIGGRWNHQSDIPPEAETHPVGRAMAWLGALHRERTWLTPSQVLERIVRERRLMEVAFAEVRPRDAWRRLRFVIDQARAWQSSAGGTLRDYLTWVERQAAEGSRVIETVLPETDDEAVRIMTVHGAKGLEFPVTIMSGMTTQMVPRPRGVQVLFPPNDGGWAIKLGADIATAEFEAYAPIDEQMDNDERLRLLYVAATRARDHLVVSVHRKPPPAGGGTRAPTSAEVLWTAGRHDGLVVYSEDLPPLLRPAPGLDAGESSSLERPDPDRWAEERRRAFVSGTRPLARSATGVAELLTYARAAAEGDPGLAKEQRDLDLPPWQKGRYGTAVGRAVHGVLQTIDLATGEGVAAAAAAQAAAEGVLGRERVIEDLARSALGTAVVRLASSRRMWREVYVGAEFEGIVLEGFIDLLWQDDDGSLVVVDYKTDAWHDQKQLEQKGARYGPQLAAYALATERATGLSVNRAVLLFLGRDGAVEYTVDDVRGRAAEVMSILEVSAR